MEVILNSMSWEIILAKLEIFLSPPLPPTSFPFPSSNLFDPGSYRFLLNTMLHFLQVVMTTIYKDYPWGKFYVFALDQNIPLLWDLMSPSASGSTTRVTGPKPQPVLYKLTLPCKHHDNSSSFQENFIFAMLNHGGFGLL